MADIVMTDDGIEFDGRTLEERPLGGAETSFIELANAMAARGHRVRVFNKTPAPVTHRDVAWAPLAAGMPQTADLYIANRNTALLGLVPKAPRCLFWIHNPAGYLLKLRHQTRLAQRRPVIVFSGQSHAGTYPAFGFSGGRTIIPYGVTEIFRKASPREAPAPRAIFTSNPLRSLDWILDLWEQRIRPQCPAAALHVFAGAATYGAAGAAKAGAMGPVLERAAALAGQGVVLRAPVPKARLVEELALARALLYRGDIGETFCSAVAEAQAMGVPAVLEDIACMKERVRPGETGFVVRGADEFAARALSLLTDDALWQSQHNACLASQRSFGWSEAAELFEGLL
jgi:glycosyltransferase involved in cell wall biosynthesis